MITRLGVTKDKDIALAEIELMKDWSSPGMICTLLHKRKSSLLSVRRQG